MTIRSIWASTTDLCVTPLVGQISSVNENITLWELDLAIVGI